MPQPRFKGRFRKAGEANRRKKCSDRLHNINSLKHTPLADTDESQLAEEQQTVSNIDDKDNESVTDPDNGPPAKKKLQWDEGRRIVELKVI